jgi:hypothetical protein
MKNQKPNTKITRQAKRVFGHLLRNKQYSHSLKALEFRDRLRKSNLSQDIPINLSQHLHQLNVDDIPTECLEKWNNQRKVIAGTTFFCAEKDISSH